jgi:peptide/nickel transport system permease protein/oligopeptide transport system permease protein
MAGQPSSLIEATQEPGPLVVEDRLPPSTGNVRRAWRRFRANRLAVAGLVAFVLLVAAAIAAPLITPAGYADQNYLSQTYAFPSAAHWFGVDPVGRDFFSRNIYAGRVSLSIGFFSALAAGVIGISLGALAGYRGGVIDWLVVRVVEVFSVVPPLLVAILLATLSSGGYLILVAVISLTSWVGMCRLVRGDMLTLREEDYVLAARAVGVPTYRIVVRHMLPNALGPIIVSFVLTVVGAIGTEAALSYLGVGINPPTPSWGRMISDGVLYVSYYWHLALFPVLMLAITVLSLSFISDGLRDALDPTIRS